MRTFSAYASLSSELLWWDVLIGASQGCGNCLKKSFWESLERAVYSVKNGAMPCRQVLAGANYFVDDEGGKILRASDATCTASAEKSRRLFPEAQVSLRNIFGFARAFVQEGSLNSGADSNISGSTISVDVYSRNGVTKDFQCSSFGKWVSRDAMCARQASLGDGSLAVKHNEKMQEEGVQPNKVSLLSMLRAYGNGERKQSFFCLDQNAAVYNKNKNVIEAASILESAFTQTCAKHGALEESFVIHDMYRQLSLVMDAAGISQKQNSSLGILFDKLSSVTLFSWMEQIGSKSHDNIYLNPFDKISLVKFGMLVQNHVVSSDLEANAWFWTGLADLYAEGWMPMDAHNALKSLESTLAVPFRALIEGCTLRGECSKYTEYKGEQSNESVNSGLLPLNHKGHSQEKCCAFTGWKHSMVRRSLPRSSACLKEINGLGRPIPSIDFRRAMSTSTEKQCDEDVGEQQSSGQQQSSSQQQSSLELPDSKPRGTSSWPNPDNAASYVLMSNIYADGDRWDEVKRINEMRLKARAWKKPGKAYVEIKAKVHEFIVGDRTHQDSVNIYEKLRKIKRHMGHIGYVPNVDLVLENRSSYDPYKPR